MSGETRPIRAGAGPQRGRVGPGSRPRRILIGLDDTDMPGTPGTNQLARRITEALPSGFRFDVVLRHQLLFDRRIPYTSHNGCASIAVQAEPSHDAAGLLDFLRRTIREFAPAGSDPGLCIFQAEPAENAGRPTDLQAFAARCQREPVRQSDARALAHAHGIHLEPLGGTGDGIIGALAAVGLHARGDDGRVVHRTGWPWPDAFAGEQTADAILARGVDEIRSRPRDTDRGHRDNDGRPVTAGIIDVGKHLRPSFRNGKVVLFVEPATVVPGAAVPHQATDRWTALKLP